MKLLLIGAYILAFASISSAQKGEQLAIHFSEKGISELLDKTLKTIEVGDANELKIHLLNSSASSSVELESIEGANKEVLNALTPFDMNRPLVKLFYEMSDVYVKSDLSKYKFNTVRENGQDYIIATVTLNNSKVGIPSLNICDDKDKIEVYDKQTGQWRDICRSLQASTVENIVLSQQGTPLIFKAKFKVDLNQNSQKIKMVSLNSNMDNVQGSKLIKVEDFQLTSLEDQQIVLSKELDGMKESVSFSLEDTFKEILLSDEVFDELSERVLKELEKSVSQNLSVIINNSLESLFESLNSKLIESNLELKEETQITIEEKEDESTSYLDALARNLLRDSTSVQQEFDHKMRVKNGKLPMGAIFEQVLSQINGLKLNLKRTGVNTQTGTDLTLFYDVDVETADTSYEGNEFINTVEDIHQIPPVDFYECKTDYDMGISVSEPLINSVLELGDELDIYNELIQKNTFADELALDRVRAFFIPASEADNGIARIDIVADISILMSKSSWKGTAAERFTNSDGFWTTMEGHKWKFKAMGQALKALVQTGWKSKQSEDKVRDYSELGDYFYDEAVTFKTPLELQYEIHDSENGQVLVPRNPIDEDGNFKNTHNSYHSNLDKKSSAVVKGLKKTISELYNKIDEQTQEPAGLGKVYPVDLSFLKNQTNNVLEGKKIEIQSSGHMILYIDIHEDKLFEKNGQEGVQ